MIELHAAARLGHLVVCVRGAPELSAWERDELTDDKEEQNTSSLMHQMSAGSLECDIYEVSFQAEFRL